MDVRAAAKRAEGQIDSPASGERLSARIGALRTLRRDAEALAALDVLTRRWRDCAPAHDARGVMLAEAGRLAEARAAFAAALAIDPAFARAHFGLATLGRVAPRQLAAMEILARGPKGLDEAGRLFLLYALAKAYDEAGDVARAFAAAEAGAGLRRARWTGDAAVELARLDEAAPGAVRISGAGDPELRLAFVFGLPRSGTTLVEQILANHGDVVALGETESLAQEAERHANPADLARAYRAALPAAARGAACVIDKSLGSALHIGAIRAAFPKARLVHVRRDPRDVGLSCHFTLFQHDLPFPPDLEGFGRYARAHATLMQAWGRVLPRDVWREQSYEALVAAPERETRDLLAFLGLDPRPECLAFAGARGEVRTASVAQVREAPHTRSVGRWRRYAQFLAPLLDAL